MLSKYADTLKRRGLDTCSSQILADVLESFPKSVSVKQLALNTGKTEKYINSKLRAMKRDDVPISIKKGSNKVREQGPLFKIAKAARQDLFFEYKKFDLMDA